MFSFIQVLIFSLIVLSFLIINMVPVILATPGEWEKSQSLVWRGLFFWSFLVILIGILTLVSK